MHELGIVFHIIDDIEEVGAQNELTKVSKVVLEVGEVSTIIDTYLTDCWKWAANKSELLKGAELEIITLPAITMCSDCNETYPTVENGKICPHCGGENTYLVTGNEVNIREIEAC